MRDDRLAARAAKGDRHAFGELYRRHHQRVYRYCLSLVGDPEDAADALQSTMAKALSALEAGEAIRGVRPWLFRIAHNAAIDLLRMRRPRTPFEEIEQIESSALTAPSAASEAQSRADLAEVVSDIRALPERQGSALVMRELSELSYAEIAGALDTSPLAARQLVHQARSLLHDNRDGRAMDCEDVRQGLGDADGGRTRDRRMRAHLAECQSCQAFGRSIRARRSALAAIAQPLVPAAASEILTRLFQSSSTSSQGVAAGGLTVGAAKIAGASGIAKIAGAAAAGTVAVAVVGGGALLGPGEVDSTPRGGAQALLRPSLPGALPMPRGAERPDGGGSKGAGRDGDGPRVSGPGADASAADEPESPAGPSGDGPPAAMLARSDPPVDLRVVQLPVASRGGLLGRDRGVDLRIELPGKSSKPTDGLIELPDGSGGSGVEVPNVEIPDIDVPKPSVDVDVGRELRRASRRIRRLGRLRGRVPDVEIPDSDVPKPSVEILGGSSVGTPSPSSIVAGR